MATRAELAARLLPLFLCLPAAAMAQHGSSAVPSERPGERHPAPVGLRELAALAPAERIMLLPRPVTVTIPLPQAVRSEMIPPAAGTTLILAVEDITFDETPPGYFEVYLDQPPGERPDYKSPHYVGNLSFFGLQGEGGRSRPGAAFRLNLTPTIRALQSRGLWKDDAVTVTFVPATPEDSEGRPTQPSPGIRVGVASLKILAAPRR